MRRIQRRRPGEVYDYTPEAFGNRNDPDPVVVSIRAPSESDRRRIEAGGEPIRMRRTGDGDLVAIDLDHVRSVQELACRLCVVSVRNYIGADGKPIDTGDRLAEHGEAEIVSEVYLEIIKGMEVTPEQGKHYAEPSASTEAERSTSGTASSADGSAGTTTATAPIQIATQDSATSRATG